MPTTATVFPPLPFHSYTHTDPRPLPSARNTSYIASAPLPNPSPSPRIAPQSLSLAPPTSFQKQKPSPQSSHESSIVTDSTDVRSSSEHTAATIFSMYDEDHDNGRPTSSSGTKPSLQKDLPPVPVQVVETLASPVTPPASLPISRPPSDRLRSTSGVSIGAQSATLLLPRREDDGLSVPSPQITVSSQSTQATMSRSSSHAYSVQGPDEDADHYHVRATYARLDVEGVPGDGFEEGKERTRTRIASVYSIHPLLDLATSGLSVKEESTLKGLDRYGFFMISDSQRDMRLALIPASPLQKAATPTKLSSRSTQPTPSELTSMPTLPSVPKEKESERIDKWDRMMKVARRDEGGNAAGWTFDKRKGRKLRLRIYKGVPDRWRGAAWWSVIERMNLPRSAADPPNAAPSELMHRYRELIDQPSTCDVQIDLDVPRTISGHVFFHTRYGLGQRSLFHVLHCFSLLCPKCGYVQGMGPIAATLLCYLDPEKAYVCMVRLHDEYGMHAIFQEGFPGLLEALYIQERLMERLLPDVYTSFRTHMISSTSYATKWYITLFANSVPFQTQLRLWDAFFFEGRDFIIIVAVAILWSLRDYLASPEANFETILSLLSSYFVPEDEDVLLSWIRNTLDDSKLRADMTGWRTKWSGLVERGESNKALL